MRTFSDRIRHAIMFELIGLAIFTPGAALLFDQPMGHMGVIGVVSATAATLWNFVFNLGFDRAMLRLRGSVETTMSPQLMLPASGRKNPAARCSSEVLPEPDGPRRPISAPGGTTKSGMSSTRKGRPSPSR